MTFQLDTDPDILKGTVTTEMKWFGQLIQKLWFDLKRNAKIALKVKGQGRMSPTSKYF